MDLFKEFFEKGTFTKSLNATVQVLIPRKGGVEDLGQFKPISLVGSLYKLLAKALTNRLKKVVGKVVSKAQNAFVEGRQIIDASLIANEIVDYWNKKRVKGVVCKMDIEKAYDSINWQFLLKVMQCMGFGDKWVGWIWWCISTVRFSVLINKVPTCFFPCSRDLRQGDPLSPYLFVMVMEVLLILIWRATDGGYISGRVIRGKGEADLNISYLLFANETIVFCETSKDQMLFLSWEFLWFEAPFRLSINWDKSELISMGMVTNMDELAVELGCQVGSLPTNYLGLPLGAAHKSMVVWEGVEERLRKGSLVGKEVIYPKEG